MQAVAGYLIAHRAERDVEWLVAAVGEELQRAGRQVSATVRSAHPLPEALLEQVRALLTERYGIATVALETDVDPSLIGGAVVSLPGKELDLSVRRMLNQLPARVV